MSVAAITIAAPARNVTSILKASCSWRNGFGIGCRFWQGRFTGRYLPMTKAGLFAAAVVAAAISLGVPTGAGAAAGGPSDSPTFFTEFDFGGGKFAGKIDSGTAKCKRNRTIALYRKKNGNTKNVGSDKTNDKGKFKIGIGNPKNGKYVAQAKESSYEDGNGDRITCLEEKSAKVELG